MNVTTRELCYDIDGAHLVGSIDLTIEQGTLLAIVGPNGAGKSTLLRLLAGDLRPSTGSVAFDGREAADVSVADLARVRAVLAQEQSADVAFSVEEVVGMGRYALRTDPGITPGQHQSAITTAIETVDLQGLEERPVASLSGGERQRTAIARVLAQDAPLMLLDEPTTALDIGHQQLVLQVLVGLADQDRTVIAVMHDLNLAARFDNVIVLEKGAMAAHGAADEVLTAERLSAVYGYPIQVVDHPLHSGSLILPQPAS